MPYATSSRWPGRRRSLQATTRNGRHYRHPVRASPFPPSLPPSPSPLLPPFFLPLHRSSFVLLTNTIPPPLPQSKPPWSAKKISAPPPFTVSGSERVTMSIGCPSSHPPSFAPSLPPSRKWRRPGRREGGREGKRGVWLWPGNPLMGPRHM